MTKAIQQSVRFAAPPTTLFDIYLDSGKYSAATGGKATMSRKAGGKIEATLAPADEVHDFEAVTRFDRSLLPADARQNVQIALDGHTPGGHPEMIQQRGHVQAVGNVAAFAVNRDGHCSVRNWCKPLPEATEYRSEGRSFSDCHLLRERIAKRISSLPPSPRAWMTSARSPFPSGGRGNSIRTRPRSSLVPA